MPDQTAPGRAAVLTVSDRASRGALEDSAGPAVAALLTDAGFEVAPVALLPDDAHGIADWLHRQADGQHVALAVTVGGTGVGPRDHTPQATAQAIDYPIPGIAEAMRAASIATVPTAMLSRAVAGVRGRTLILNLPGSERGARENLEVVLPILAHAIAQITGAADDAPPAGTHGRG